MANVPDAFVDLLHGVLVYVGVLIELPEVLNDPESLALLLRNAEYVEHVLLVSSQIYY